MKIRRGLLKHLTTTRLTKLVALNRVPGVLLGRENLMPDISKVSLDIYNNPL